MPINDKRVLGVIPARGGSKGVKRKNVRLVAGKPLIAYSIQSAFRSDKLTDFYVSTDDKEIASVASSLGAEIIERPAELAQDGSPMLPVLCHALLEAEKRNACTYDYLMILQPTAPMRDEEDIDDAIDKIISNGKDSLVSLYRVEDCHPSRMYTIDGGQLNKVMDEPAGSLRQALPDVFHRNGCIYISSRSLLLDQQKLMSSECLPYIMSEEKSVNIDTELDLEYADFILSKMSNG